MASLGLVLADVETIDRRIAGIATHRFRAKFHLYGPERALVLLRGRDAIREHARDLIEQRVAPALEAPEEVRQPPRDRGGEGEQGGHHGPPG